MLRNYKFDKGNTVSYRASQSDAATLQGRRECVFRLVLDNTFPHDVLPFAICRKFEVDLIGHDRRPGSISKFDYFYKFTEMNCIYTQLRMKKSKLVLAGDGVHCKVGYDTGPWLAAQEFQD